MNVYTLFNDIPDITGIICFELRKKKKKTLENDLTSKHSFLQRVILIKDCLNRCSSR